MSTPAAPAEAAASQVVDPPEKNADPLQRVSALYERKDFSAALKELIEISRQDPSLPGAVEMRGKILRAISEQRAVVAAADTEMSRTRMAVESAEKAVIPDTYGLEKFVQPDVADHIAPPSAMRKALQTPVSIHLRAATLSSFLESIAKAADLNVIADKALGEGKSVDIEADNVPLSEILDYISRNYGVQFYLGENLIWVTSPEKKALPLVTRVYRLNKGLHYHGSDWGTINRESGDPLGLSFKSAEVATATNYIVSIIRRFVPAAEGAEVYMEPNTHSLFVRDTPENLEVIEQIISTLDVTPAQVLIEARFVEVVISDLRELGIEWILNSPLVVTEKGVLQDGRMTRAPATQVDPGNIVSFTPYASDDQGVVPLGPRGSFGDVRAGNPPTAEQGVNFTYQGILTEPMFQAVLHAIAISGKSRTLSVPRVTTMNNNPAKLRNGEDLRFYEEFQAQAFSLVDINNQKYTITVLIPKGKPAVEELGITLVAVPSVGQDKKTISLLLTPTISRLEGFTSYQDESLDLDPGTITPRQVVVKLPIVSRREIQTKVVVESGETVVLGGLIETVTQDTIHKVPVLGSIPLLGNLFKRIDSTEERKNLLIFVTATVISERGESLLPGR